jgi:hypothetical protein
MHSEGLEISNSAGPFTFAIQDDFDMDGDDEEEACP